MEQGWLNMMAVVMSWPKSRMERVGLGAAQTVGNGLAETNDLGAGASASPGGERPFRERVHSPDLPFGRVQRRYCRLLQEPGYQKRPSAVECPACALKRQ